MTYKPRQDRWAAPIRCTDDRTAAELRKSAQAQVTEHTVEEIEWDGGEAERVWFVWTVTAQRRS